MAWKPVYVSLVEMKGDLRITHDDDDAQITRKLATASRDVDDHCNRQFGQEETAVERVYPVRYHRRQCRYVVDIDDLMTTTDLVVEVDGVAIAAADLTFWPRNAARDGMPWERLILPRGGTEATITAQWGWLAIPDKVKEATTLQCARLMGRRDAAFGISGSPQAQGEIRLLDKLDVDAVTSLRGLRRRVWVR